MAKNYLLTEIVRKAEAAFLTHTLEASAAAMNGVLCQEEDYREDYECKQSENEKSGQGDNPEKPIRLMLNVGDHLYTAELAHFLHWSGQKNNLASLNSTYSMSKCYSDSSWEARACV